jgi:histone deacetylase complex regulatory component SIN3
MPDQPTEKKSDINEDENIYNEDMSNATDRLFINMRIIGGLLPHQKVNAKDEMLTVEPSTWLPEFVYRWWRADDRVVLLRRLDEVINETISQLHLYKRNKRLKKKYLTHLFNSVPGLVNLKQTYAVDAQCVSHIDLLVENIKEQLCQYKFEPERTVIMNELPQSSDDESVSSGDEVESHTRLGRVLND